MPPNSSPKARVIVVEDELAHAELIDRAFQSRQDQFELRVVQNVAEARRRLDQEPYDLVITDLVLPGLKGAEIASKVRALHPEVKVVFMSAYPAEKLHAEGRLSPEEESIQKPFRERDLLAEVYRVLHDGAPAEIEAASVTVAPVEQVIEQSIERSDAQAGKQATSRRASDKRYFWSKTTRRRAGPFESCSKRRDTPCSKLPMARAHWPSSTSTKTTSTW